MNWNRSLEISFDVANDISDVQMLILKSFVRLDNKLIQ